MSRFLNVTFPGLKKPGETLSGDSVSDFSGKSCVNCLAMVDSFCQMYDLWFCLQLEMNWCLEKIALGIQNADMVKKEINQDCLQQTSGCTLNSVSITINATMGVANKAFRNAFLKTG